LSDEYVVRWFREDDLPAYVEGLNKDLYDEYDEEVFDWKFRRAPFSLGFISIAVVEHVPTGAPVAFNPFMPLEVRVGGEVFTALQGVDGFVDEAHRRRGLFQRTITFMAEEMKGRSPELLFSFNLAEAAGAAHKADSELVYDMDKCLLDRGRFAGLARRGGVELEPIGTETYHRLYETWAETSGLIHLHRAVPYLRWRVDENPVREVTPYRLVSSGAPRGYVVVDEVTEGGINQLTIDDYPPGLLDAALPEVIACLNVLHPDAGVVEVNAVRGSRLEEAAYSMGFTVRPWLTVIMKALNNVVQEGGEVYRGELRLSDVNNWHLTPSDIY
jgi:hypothetical protein